MKKKTTRFFLFYAMKGRSQNLNYKNVHTYYFQECDFRTFSSSILNEELEDDETCTQYCELSYSWKHRNVKKNYKLGERKEFVDSVRI